MPRIFSEKKRDRRRRRPKNSSRRYGAEFNAHLTCCFWAQGSLSCLFSLSLSPRARACVCVFPCVQVWIWWESHSRKSLCSMLAHKYHMVHEQCCKQVWNYAATVSNVDQNQSLPYSFYCSVLCDGTIDFLHQTFSKQRYLVFSLAEIHLFQHLTGPSVILYPGSWCCNAYHVWLTDHLMESHINTNLQYHSHL